jgi:histidinol dehydrogenase
VTLRIVHQRDLTDRDRDILFERRQSLDDLRPVVQEIMNAVRSEGDEALRWYTERFDGVNLQAIAVSSEEFARARAEVDPAVREALQAQVTAVERFHSVQIPLKEPVETAPGVCTWREWRPIERGDYATGTNHVLPTARYARTFAPVSVESFGRMIQCQEVSAEGLASLRSTITRLAREEGLEAHARAVEVRFEGERS